jgi:hypothetical protein
MGAKKDATTTQTNTVNLSPAQKEIEKLLIPQAQAAANVDYTPFAGTTIAGFSPEELQSQEMFKALAGANSGIGQGVSSANAAQQFLMSPDMLTPDKNPYLKAQGDALASQIGQNFQNVIMPGLRADDVQASGVYSGGNTKAGIAQGLAAQGATTSIGNSLTDLYFKSYQNGLQTMGQAVDRNPQALAANMLSPTIMGAVGEQQRAMEQAKLSEAENLYYLQKFAPLLKAQDLAALLGQLPGGGGTSTVTGAQPSSGGIKGALGGAASGAAIGSVVPVIGTGIGAALGGLAGFFA